MAQLRHTPICNKSPEIGTKQDTCQVRRVECSFAANDSGHTVSDRDKATKCRYDTASSCISCKNLSKRFASWPPAPSVYACLLSIWPCDTQHVLRQQSAAVAIVAHCGTLLPVCRHSDKAHKAKELDLRLKDDDSAEYTINFGLLWQKQSIR